MADEPRVTAWERRLDWPLTALAVVFLVAYAWSVLDTGLGPRVSWWLDALLWTTWALFTMDYLVRLWLAERRWRFVRRHVLDVVVILLPMFRQLRVLRLLTILNSLHRQVSNDFRGRVGIYVAGATGLVGFAAALAVYDAERRNPDATITTFGDAVWWVITTISTVGYGDRYPVTWQGRVIAGSLMIAGIALLGTVTATIASVFVDRLRVVEQAERESQVELAQVLAELRLLRARLDGELETGAEPKTGAEPRTGDELQNGDEHPPGGRARVGVALDEGGDHRAVHHSHQPGQ